MTGVHPLMARALRLAKVDGVQVHIVEDIHAWLRRRRRTRVARSASFAPMAIVWPHAAAPTVALASVLVEERALGIAGYAIELAHEVAHVLVGGDPEDCDEVRGPLLAIEHELLRRLGVRPLHAWRDWYFTDDDTEGWGSLSVARRRDLLRRSRMARTEGARR